MTARQRVLVDALRLPEGDRVAIAGALLRSLSNEPEESAENVEEAWAEEIRRRLSDLDSGVAETMSVDDARRFITSDGEDR